MTRFKAVMLVAGLLIALGMASGCLLFVAGAAAGVGAVAYTQNELRTAREVAMEPAWNATQAAMKETGCTIVPAETHWDATNSVVKGRNAKDQVVKVKLTAMGDKITEFRVRVGTFDTAEDRKAERELFDAICKHF